MSPYFKISGKIATSSSVEAEFSDLKSRAVKGQLPMRIDKFIIQHLKYLDAKISLTCNEKDISVTSNPTSSRVCIGNKILSEENTFSNKIDISDMSMKNDDSENILENFT